MNNKNVIIKLVAGLIIVLGIRFIGIEHIPYFGVLAVLLFGVLYFVWSIFSISKRQKKDKYFLIFAINLIAFTINISILYTIQYKYPSYLSFVKPILIPIFIILLISTTISVFMWAINSNKK